MHKAEIKIKGIKKKKFRTNNPLTIFSLKHYVVTNPATMTSHKISLLLYVRVVSCMKYCVCYVIPVFSPHPGEFGQWFRALGSHDARIATPPVRRPGLCSLFAKLSAGPSACLLIVLPPSPARRGGEGREGREIVSVRGTVEGPRQMQTLIFITFLNKEPF